MFFLKQKTEKTGPVIVRKLRPVDEGTELEHQIEVPVLEGEDLSLSCLSCTAAVVFCWLSYFSKKQDGV